jgi:hypothetical protein
MPDTQEVQDKVTERTGILGNILVGLLLTATIAYGNSITMAVENLTKVMYQLVTVTEVNKKDIQHIVNYAKDTRVLADKNRDSINMIMRK